MNNRPTDQERWYRERGKALLHASEAAEDPTMALAFAIQSERVYMKAVQLEVARKQETLKALGIPLTV